MLVNKFIWYMFVNMFMHMFVAHCNLLFYLQLLIVSYLGMHRISGRMFGMAEFLAWPNVWYDRMSGMAEYLVWPNVWYGRMSGMAKCLVWPNVWYGRMSGMA